MNALRDEESKKANQTAFSIHNNENFGHQCDNKAKEVMKMKVSLNPDQQIVDTVREGLKRTGGYCPCRLERTEATKCMCQEFKDQIADPNYEGFCHCMLYYKSLQD